MTCFFCGKSVDTSILSLGRWMCKLCKRMKGKLSEEAFLIHIQRIVATRDARILGIKS